MDYRECRVQLQRQERSVGDEVTRWLDFDSPQVDVLLLGLLSAGIQRTGGSMERLGEYSLTVLDLRGRRIRTFAAGAVEK